LSGKDYKDENFPVSSFLIDKKLKKIVRVFYFYARTADDIADHAFIKKKEKLRILNFFDNCLKNKKRSEISVVNKLISYFNKYKFSKKYARDLLVAFKMDVTKNRYEDWSELLHYCKFSANPVGRFVINATYSQKKKKANKTLNLEKILHASDSLCTALQIINHMQDCKEDFKNLDRVYIPKNLFKKHKLNVNILMKNNSCQNFSRLKIEIICKVENLLKDIKKSLQLIDIWKLKKETLIILNIAKRLCFLLKIKDPLKKKIKLSTIDLLFCFIKGIIWD
jgi:squalene synthase HpnC